MSHDHLIPSQRLPIAASRSLSPSTTTLVAQQPDATASVPVKGNHSRVAPGVSKGQRGMCNMSDTGSMLSTTLGQLYRFCAIPSACSPFSLPLRSPPSSIISTSHTSIVIRLAVRPHNTGPKAGATLSQLWCSLCSLGPSQ